MLAKGNGIINYFQKKQYGRGWTMVEELSTAIIYSCLEGLIPENKSTIFVY